MPCDTTRARTGRIARSEISPLTGWPVHFLYSQHMSASYERALSLLQAQDSPDLGLGSWPSGSSPYCHALYASTVTSLLLPALRGQEGHKVSALYAKALLRTLTSFASCLTPHAVRMQFMLSVLLLLICVETSYNAVIDDSSTSGDGHRTRSIERSSAEHRHSIHSQPGCATGFSYRLDQYIPSTFEMQWQEHLTAGGHGTEDACSFMQSNADRIKNWLETVEVCHCSHICAEYCSFCSLMRHVMSKSAVPMA